jgi:hypothetical protein
MRASVIVPVKDDPPIERCVRALLALQAPPGGLELIVVDNGSAPEFRRGLTGLPATICVLDESMPGPAAARNRGIAAATGEVLFFTDADCVVQPDWVRCGLEGLERTGADILRGASGGIAPNRTAAVIEASFAWRRRWRAGQAVNVDSKNLAVRRPVFGTVCFNPESMRAEDVEFGRAAARAGFRTAYWPAMRLDHEHEDDVRLFLAKKMAGGWVLERTSPARRGGVRRMLARPTVLRIAAAAVFTGGVVAVAASRGPGIRAGGSLLRVLTLVALGVGRGACRAGLPQAGPGAYLDRTFVQARRGA